jgi:hypothetical protein
MQQPNARVACPFRANRNTGTKRGQNAKGFTHAFAPANYRPMATVMGCGPVVSSRWGAGTTIFASCPLPRGWFLPPLCVEEPQFTQFLRKHEMTLRHTDHPVTYSLERPSRQRRTARRATDSRALDPGGHPSDAIVRVEMAAICGSDLNLYHGMMPDTRVA